MKVQIGFLVVRPRRKTNDLYLLTSFGKFCSLPAA